MGTPPASRQTPGARDTPGNPGTPGLCPLLVVVVNYKTPDLTIACLRSLAGEARTLEGLRVVVVENASGDGSPEALRQAIAHNHWDRWARVLPAPRNLGFAGGNNFGIAGAEPSEYVLLLNSDTVVNAGCLSQCLRVMEGDPRIGVLSCRVLSPDQTIQPVGRRFPTPARALCSALGLPWRWPRLFGWANIDASEWNRREEVTDVGWVSGAFMLLRSSCLSGRVRLDEDFFFLGEDIEVCNRVRRAGFRRVLVPEASIIHYGGASSDPTRMPSPERGLHAWRARYLVQRKCYGAFWATALRLADIAVAAARVGVARLRRGGADPRTLAARAQLRLVLSAAG